LSVALLVAGGGRDPGKTNPFDSSGFDTAKDDAAAAEAITPAGMIDPCDPRAMSGYRTASPLARSIADGSEWDLSDEAAALALLDSFQRSDQHDFYSTIILRSIAKADGAYSEALGLLLHDQLLANPCHFLSCCWENGCDGHEGLLLWTKAIAHELMIAHEEDPWAGFVAYGRQVEQRAQRQCDLQTGSRTNEFLWQIGAYLKSGMAQDSLK
jgi:hypothetical protein